MSNLDRQLSMLKIEKGRRRARGGGALWFALAMLLAAGAGAYFYYAKSNAALAVRTARVEREAGSETTGAALLTSNGYIIPRQKVEVTPKIIGRVKEILVKRGDHVQEGDVLLRLDDEEYQARIKSGEAMLNTLRSRLAELKAGSRPEEIAAARAAAESAEATLRSAELDFKRVEALAGKGAISRQELDRARANRDVAKARLEQERKSAEVVRLGPRKEEIAAMEAQLEQASAELELLRAQLEYTVIRAPISGTILEKLAERGELVTNTNFGGTRGAKTSVVSMADLKDLQVETDLNENSLAKVHLGLPCEIQLDSEPGNTYHGEVDEIAPQADRQKGTVQAKVRILDPSDTIKIDVNARVTFLAPKEAEAGGAPAAARLWVPRGAVVHRDGQSIVYLVSEDTAVARAVTAGVEGDKGVEITGGLAGTEQVIVDPLEKIKDGARVTVTP